MREFIRLLNWGSVILFIAGLGFATSVNGGLNNIIWFTCFPAFCWWVIILCVKFGRFWDREAAIMDAPIPSPDQIAYDLQQYYGRQPSLDEVLAVHRYHQEQKAIAAAKLGGGLAAIFYAGHVARKIG
jgi:hypothetical protein